MPSVKWKRKPDAHDYPAADSYLSLLVADAALRTELVAQLQVAPLLQYKAKDLLRASQLPLLPPTNPHVATDLKKIRKGVALSPVLLVRGDLVGGFPLQVADGYHRVCASYGVDENTDIPCRMIDLPAATPARPAPRTVARATPAVAVAPAQPVAAPEKAVAKRVPVRKTAPAKKTAAVKTAVPPVELPVAPAAEPAAD